MADQPLSPKVPPMNCTWCDLVRRVARQAGVTEELDEKEIDWILWERTPFPMGGYELTLAALVKFFADYNGSHDYGPN